MPFMGLASRPELVDSLFALHYLYVKGGFASPRCFLIFWGGVVLLAMLSVNLLNAVTLWIGCNFGRNQGVWWEPCLRTL